MAFASQITQRGEFSTYLREGCGAEEGGAGGGRRTDERKSVIGVEIWSVIVRLFVCMVICCTST
jgi:hypothetical protein